MKRKTPTSIRRLPIDFGAEPLRPVPILSVCGSGRQSALASRNSRKSQTANRKSGRSAYKVGQTTFYLTINGVAPAAPGSVGGKSGQRTNSKLKIQNSKLASDNSSLITRHSSLGEQGFTLVEILVVLVLLSLIVFALMAVFNGAQRAFRASLTQTDILEGGRAVMDLIADDLQTMTPCDYPSNFINNSGSNLPANFFVSDYQFSTPYPPTPLYQPLIGSASGVKRTNLLENIYILSKGNVNGVPTWIGTGYSVSANLSDGTLYPLYRFYMTTNVSSGAAGIAGMCDTFLNFNYTNSANWSHLIDGVIGLTARVYDTNGVLMTNGYINPSIITLPRFVYFTQGMNGDGLTDSVFFSNALPASVQIDLATLEDRTLAHAEGLSGVNQSNYLSSAAGHVHVFRQRVWIRNLDITAYQ